MLGVQRADVPALARPVSEEGAAGLADRRLGRPLAAAGAGGGDRADAGAVSGTSTRTSR